MRSISLNVRKGASKAARSIILAVSLFMSLQSFAGQIGNKKFPDGPDQRTTPGDLCKNSNNYRYPEHIKYCERAVDPGLKAEIIANYDREFGYDIRQLPRGDFKIDHFIPLSIGGSNDVKNLWPQHRSVYKYSDTIELQVFELISKGKIKQVDAIQAIKDCKLNLDRCSDISDSLKQLY